LSLLIEALDSRNALNYHPGARRDHGRPRKRLQRFDAGTGQTTKSMEDEDDDDDDGDIINRNI
jgi:hypothetical protein